MLSRSRSILLLSAIAALVVLTPQLRAQTHTVVLDDFAYQPYGDHNPDGLYTTVSFPTYTHPTFTPLNATGWQWWYTGYGTPATGARDTTTFYTSPASWRFEFPQNAFASGNMTNQGPIVGTRFNSSSYEPRTFDQILAQLGEPPIDWSKVVRFAVNVRANWSPNSGTGTFGRIEQGIFVFHYSTGTQNSVNVTYNPTISNDTSWHEASIEVLGKDSNDRFDLGTYGAVDWDPTGANATFQSPKLDFWFDNLRVIYTPQSVTQIPALSIFGLLALCALLAGAGFWMVKR